ncbi:MAG: hypothetical protein OEO77_05245 [Acidimicrobiia bacterium]|nr:hypothetical protein [Acidimicrobiia bacterium]
MVRSSFLRVYVPVDQATFSVLELPEAPVTSSTPVRAGRYGLVDEPLVEVVHVAQWGGDRYVCPRRARLRMLEGVVAFHNAYAEVGGSLMVPEQVATRAAAELRALHDREPEQRSHILTSTWHVPLRWFVAFESDDRELLEREDGLTVVYRTPIGEARHRLHAALSILERVDMDETVIQDLSELIEWLDDFPDQALVELDYGSVAGMFDPSELVLDDSAADVWASLEALASDDWEEAARHYGQVAARWSTAMAVSFSN